MSLKSSTLHSPLTFNRKIATIHPLVDEIVETSEEPPKTYSHFQKKQKVQQGLRLPRGEQVLKSFVFPLIFVFFYLPSAFSQDDGDLESLEDFLGEDTSSDSTDSNILDDDRDSEISTDSPKEELEDFSPLEDLGEFP